MKMLDDASPREWDELRYKDTKLGKLYHPADKHKADWDTFFDDDPVDSPAHYNKGGIEAIDYIEQQLEEGTADYCLGNTHKYLHRWRYKNGIEDLKKARWYLDRLINFLEKIGWKN
jgi:hypothetical protein